jgi:LysM repeat protein
MKKAVFVVILGLLVAYFVCYRHLGWWGGGAKPDPVSEPEAGTPVPGAPGAGKPEPKKPAPAKARGVERAIAALKTGDGEKAKTELERIVAAESANPALRVRAAEALGMRLLAQGAEYEGYRKLSLAMRLARGDAYTRMETVLKPLVTKYFLAPGPTPNALIHTVQPGEVLGIIAGREKSAVGLIKLANRMQRDVIYVGQRLKVPRGPVEILVDKTEHRLTVFAGGCFLKAYRVGLGAYDQTPEGVFKIKSRLVNPPWYKPGEPKPIPSGDPRNILGTRWLGLDDPPTIGIHGIKKGEEGSIGKNMSAGCVRMLNEEVEELFDIVPRGSRVEIRP